MSYSCSVRCFVLLTLYLSLSCSVHGENELLAFPESGPLHPAVTAFFNNDENLIFTINTNNGEKITTLYSSRAKPIVKKYKFIKGYEANFYYLQCV